MKRKILVTMSLMGTVLLSGCATILSGQEQKINITSTPSKKEVTIDGKTVTTPAIITVKRQKKDLILKSKDCDTQQVVPAKINPVFFVNILSGGALGSTTDYVTGAMWKYDENIHLDCRN